VREKHSRAGHADEETQSGTIVALLWQVEVEIANGKTTPLACKEAEITVRTYYHTRKEFGGLKLDQNETNETSWSEKTRS
jgi:hypothetical protein